MGRAKNDGLFAAEDGAGDFQVHNHKADDLLQVILTNVESAVILFDGQGCCIEATDAACQLLGLEREEITEMQLADTMEDSSDGQAAASLDRLLEDGEADGSYRMRHNGNGEIIEVAHRSRADVLPGLHLAVLEVEGEEEKKEEKKEDAAEETPANELSEREKEIMTLLALGENNQTIAKRLFLSPETVRHYTRMARMKLGARSRSHAIALAVATGQIDKSSL